MARHQGPLGAGPAARRSWRWAARRPTRGRRLTCAG